MTMFWSFRAWARCVGDGNGKSNTTIRVNTKITNAKVESKELFTASVIGSRVTATAGFTGVRQQNGMSCWSVNLKRTVATISFYLSI